MEILQRLLASPAKGIVNFGCLTYIGNHQIPLLAKGYGILAVGLTPE
jgi:hypothetical protein